MDNNISKFLAELTKELVAAYEMHGGFNFTHEGYAVIKEELDELWDAIKTNNGDMREEAIQIAAMAMQFAIQFGDKDD